MQHTIMQNPNSNLPQLSIVMPVYNAGDYLVDSIASLVVQSFRDWELICVNDGSQDHSPAILDWFATQDARIHVLHQSNQGIVGALNAGCQESRSHWIVRMDADDIAFPDRLAKQIEHVRSIPGCVASGGSVFEVDAKSRPIGLRSLPRSHEEIVRQLRMGKPGLFHPTVLLHRESFLEVGGYRKEFQWIEDHDLWLRLSQVGTLSNLPTALICYRLHATSVCANRRGTQEALMSKLLQSLSIQPDRNGEPTPFEGPLASLSDDYPPSTVVNSKKKPHGNSGKWARAAMKGGYPLVALRHYGALCREVGFDPYAIRMGLELGMRFPFSLISAFQKGKIEVPRFPEWQKEWKKAEAQSL